MLTGLGHQDYRTIETEVKTYNNQAVPHTIFTRSGAPACSLPTATRVQRLQN